MGREYDKRLRFASQIGRLRMLGLVLAAPAIGSALWVNGATLPWWVMLWVTCCVWPTIAYLGARASQDPAAAEYANITVDAAQGGFWIAAMQFSLLPSTLLVTMLSISQISVGGPRLAARSFALLVLTCALTSTSLGFAFAPHSSMLNVVACAPFLFAYPAVMSIVVYELSRRVRRQNRMLEDLNRTDTLTGLPNRQHWEHLAELELERCQRTGRPASLLMIDVDAFKGVNDLYGHLVGDDAIVAVAHVLRDSIRAIDAAGRYAGDEFGIVLAEADLAGAFEVAERARARVEALRFETAPMLRVTVSIGVAELGQDNTDLKSWIHSADTALYRSKRAGRNRVMAPHDIPRRRLATEGVKRVVSGQE